MLPRARLIGLLVTVFLIAGSAAAKPLVLNNTAEPPLTEANGTGFLDRLAQEAFRRAGVELQLVKLPAERGLRNANAGIEDGDLNRIAGIERAFPNLVRVPEKNMDMDFSAFTRRPGLPTVTWQQLTTHRVGIIKGWKILEVNLKNARLILNTNDAKQLYRVLERDRVDVVLYSKLMGLNHLRRHGPRDAIVLEPPLETREMFMYLHKQHAALVPRLAAALRALKEDGTYDRFYRESITLKVAP